MPLSDFDIPRFSMNNISILQWGDLPETSLLDEVGFAVKSLTVKPTRTKKLYMNGKGAVFGARFVNPLITFSFTGMRAAPGVGGSGIGYLHPGVGIGSGGLLNFADDYRGFDPSIGVLIHEEPEDTFNGEDPAETKFDVVQYPFIETGSYQEIA